MFLSSDSDAPPTAQERYLRAVGTSDLSVSADQAGDVDKLLAAAYAVAGSPRKRLALAVYRLRATGNMAGAWELANELGQMLRGRSVRHEGRRGHLRNSGVDAIRVLTARSVAMTVLKWWQRPTCQTCGGLCHPTIPGSPVLDTSRQCEACHGTGVVQLERLVRTENIEHARWLVSEMEGLSALVFSDVGRLLAGRMGIGEAAVGRPTELETGRAL